MYTGKIFTSSLKKDRIAIGGYPLMAIKRNDKNKIPQANKLFTDREEPRKVFWDAYQLMKKQQLLTGDSDLKVITYYGIGGIGKTSLIRQLKTELDQKIQKPTYLSIDLEESSDMLATLTKIRNLLQRNYHFDFHLFDLAYFSYMQKLGYPIQKEEVQSFISSSPMLNSLLDITSALPGAGTVIGLIKGVDNLGAAIRNKLSNRSRELNEIKVDKPEILYKNLPFYLACDMDANMEKAVEPLVIFLDTYEVLVNELSSVGNPLMHDLWIRDETRGLIANFKNTLWVIAGRDKLKWETINPEWQGTLDQHLLGNLSESDAEYFLREAGVIDSQLSTEIYQLTSGIPLFLDICVDRYHSLIDKNMAPSIEDLGSNTFDLVSRFVKYMDDHKKALIYMLSCLEEWTEDILTLLVREFLPSIPFTTIDAVKNYSFILSEDGVYFKIHSSIRQIIYPNCPRTTQMNVIRYMIHHYENLLKQDAPMQAHILKRSISYHLQSGFDHELHCREWVQQTLSPKLQQLLNQCQYDDAKQLLEYLQHSIGKTFPNSVVHALLKLDDAIVLYYSGDYQLAQPYVTNAYDELTVLLGDTHKDTLKALKLLLITYRKLGNYQQSLELSKVYLERSDTLDAKINLAIAYRKIGDFNTSIQLSKEVYEIKKEQFGEAHPSTILVMSTLANAYRQSGAYEKACELSELVVRLRTQINGDLHPLTLAAISSLSHSYRLTHQFDRAVALAEVVAQEREKLLGPQHLLTIKAYNQLGNAYRQNKQYNSAYEQAQKVYQNRLETLGENHPGTIGAMSNLANSHRRLKRFETAFELSYSIYHWRLNRFGDHHPATLRALNNYALSLWTLGKVDESIALFQNQYELALKYYDATHPAAIAAVQNMKYRDDGSADKNVETDENFNMNGNVDINEIVDIDEMVDINEEDSEDVAEESETLTLHEID